MKATTSRITERMVSDYCLKRIAPHTGPAEIAALRRYLCGLVAAQSHPPRIGANYDWQAIDRETGAAVEKIERHLLPILDAISRSTRMPRTEPEAPPKPEPTEPRRATVRDPVSKAAERVLSGLKSALVEEPKPRTKRTYKKRPIEEFPTPLWTEWVDPPTFAEALNLHIKRHGDSVRHLFHAVARDDRATNHRTMMRWVTGGLVPRSVQSLSVMARIERRYRLPDGYFRAKLPHPSRASTGHLLDDHSASERRRLAWHLPDDFNSRPLIEQEEILSWVNRVIISGSTDYRVFQAAAIKTRYAVRFRAFQGRPRRHDEEDGASDNEDDEIRSDVVDATPELEHEMASLLKFKMSTLTQFGFQRNGVWGDETASQKVEHLGLMFGALAAPPRSAVRGHGVPLANLTMAMLVFPSVWDWYLQWREQRRGFFTKWEVDMLAVVIAFVKADTGWIRQTPSLSDRLQPIRGLISEADIESAKANWDAACDAMHAHGRQRIKEIQRVAKVHRDPFEPILPILEADSPVGEYRRITDEILRLMPDERRYPRAAAEAVRSLLLLRIGLHTGLRQKNLRELLVCPRDKLPTAERHLEDMKRGELRWSQREQGWEILIPSIAFKNASSSFFGKKPFRLILPNLAGLYSVIETYITRHRSQLLGPAPDPGTFFVKTVKQKSASAAYNQTTFYEAWRLVIQRYGIYNPYTGRGAIKGLLPHGPHNVRDVLATHILKKTGSYEQASYAIQDTPEMVAQHYGRFLPQDKAAIAAQVLNRVWDAA